MPTMELGYTNLVKIVITLLISSTIPQTESGSCQCTCTSNNAQGGGGGTGTGIIPGPGGESMPDSVSDPEGASVRAGPSLPSDKRFCADSDPSKCICYDTWQKDMDRVMYIPCLEGCNQWNNWFNDCKRANPGETYEFYAYKCQQCNNKGNYLNTCVIQKARAYLELLLQTSRDNGVPFESC